MTQVHVDLGAPEPDGGLRPPEGIAGRGALHCRPTRRHRDGAKLVLPDPFVVPLTDGEGTVNLRPTAPGWAWELAERYTGGVTRTVLVPDSDEVVEYADLVDVDPTTLEPDAEPEAAWWAEASAAFEAATSAQTAAVGAADAAGTAGTAATEAATAAAAAEDAATQASAAATTAANVAATKAARGLPTYVPTSVAGLYDPVFNAYNFKPSNTRRIRAALGRAAVGGLCEVAVVGDSSVAGGVGATYDRLRSWPLQARDELVRHGVPLAGTGLVRAQENTVVDSRWSFTGAWVGSNLTNRYTTANGATATLTSNLAGDRVTVLFYDSADASTFTISVNGATTGTGFATVTQSGPAGWRKHTIATPVAAGQTVTLTKTSGAFLTIAGAAVWSSTGGVMVHSLGQGGSRATGTNNAAWADTSTNFLRLGQVFANPTVSLTAPDLVICGIGFNDKSAGVTDPALMAGLTTIRNRYPSSDFLLVGTAPGDTAAVPAATWEATLAAEYALADTLDVPLVDHRARLGSFAEIVAAGLNGDAFGHLKAEAQAGLGRSLGMLLAS